MTKYVSIWFLIFILLCFEYFALNAMPSMSILRHFGYDADPSPGRPLSLLLGWAGISIMLTMNVYMIRKYVSAFKNLGSLKKWLDFHIFCGLVGPTLILFHCNFKVRGLVAISFWSMLVSVSSGVVGRYFYVQLLGLKKEIQDEAEKWSQKLKVMQAAANQTLGANQISDEKMEILKRKAMVHVGINPESVNAEGKIQMGALQVFFAALAGDIRLFFNSPKTLAGLPWQSRNVLERYALAQRRILFLEPFKNLMGYWHTFHTPFAVFMYLAAVIHIAAALLLGVH